MMRIPTIPASITVLITAIVLAAPIVANLILAITRS